MVLVSAGSPLDWEESKQYLDWVKRAGIEQFIHFYKRLTTEPVTKWMEVLRWGDEIEGVLVEFDHENRKVKLVLEADEKLEQLASLGLGSIFTLEQTNYMVECVPDKPYKGVINHLNTVESNMRKRRSLINQILKPNQYYLWYPTFPRLGCPDFTLPQTVPTLESNTDTMSVFISDNVIYPRHPRFRTLAKNIRKRRGSKVAINVPVFKDKNTPWPFIENDIPTWDGGDAKKHALPNHVFGDHMSFGMGSCALQITFQAESADEASKLYDQLATLTPVLMALGASTPIFKGYLTDEDSRWNIISQSVDCRTAEERDPSSEKHIRKSRYGPIDLYISEKHQKFNDVPVSVNAELKQYLLQEGIPQNISDHVSHLFIRDPVAVYKEQVTGEAALKDNYLKHTNHFENINSTNWQSMRFKLPPPDSNIGWRVEFRSLDVQATEFENAAFAIFIVLLSRVILTFDLRLLIPMSKLEENFQKAALRNAVLDQKFWFVNTLRCDSDCCYFLNGCNSTTDGNGETHTAADPSKATKTTIDDKRSSTSTVGGEGCKKKLTENGGCWEQMDINTIMNGSQSSEGGGGGFKGLIPMLRDYLNGMEDIDVFTRCSLCNYFSLLSKRASGELLTWASWMRKFVQSHPEYKQDSAVSESITYDLMWKYTQIVTGAEEDESVLFKLNHSPQSDLSQAEAKAQNRLYGENNCGGCTD